ncbi:hypothetical protein PF005_g23299 [Phytophthora fragariae]|uniref:Secreted protein n=1 Tax=Phytophthora fragariae TaxID=53985 RepID=A0A6A3RR37_9STRA|nr:hypothetical protein PF009_g24045 [Phytophthora fragariae]KAE8981622.1 hypothetical protein PF011_g21947 [Phytophthora fragariae]KAE9079294.1 hypothetical protein PF010_g22804 [Phytophthora fragariae]KAE9080067.1 hypothetical protein PF007_g23197 [Phytophthora fragariae]KAE9101770.1 hypothetical protein PF006_g22600 [Phytophthora fragariae]
MPPPHDQEDAVVHAGLLAAVLAAEVAGAAQCARHGAEDPCVSSKGPRETCHRPLSCSRPWRRTATGSSASRANRSGTTAATTSAPDVQGGLRRQLAGAVVGREAAPSRSRCARVKASLVAR